MASSACPPNINQHAVILLGTQLLVPVRDGLWLQSSSLSQLWAPGSGRAGLRTGSGAPGIHGA